MFVSNILNFSSEGKELYYGSIGAPLTKWGPWFGDEDRKHGTLADVQKNLKSLIDPLRLLDIYRFFSVYTTTKDSSKKIKVVCRYQQYYGGMAIVNRVMARTKNGIGPKKGLIWHFQGSGKSWLMVFAVKDKAVERVITILSRFHKFAQQLNHRHDNREAFVIKDEYDVQDFITT